MAEMTPCPPPDFSPKTPRFTLPPGSTDCHAHIFGPMAEYDYAESRGYTPTDCPLPDYQHMLNKLGLQRAVLVQPTVYGTDNAAHLDALAEAGPDFRMVAVVDETVGDAELERMHDAGVCGVRLNAVTVGGTSLKPLEVLAPRLAGLGWHIQIFASQQALAKNLKRLAGLEVPLVVDHMGQTPGNGGMEHPGFAALLRLVQEGNTWVKLSGAYRLSEEPTVPFSDITPIAQALIEAGPERMVWGSDWPHPMVNDRPMPNDGELVDLLADWAPDEVQRWRILVGNPAELYGFE